MTAPTVPALRMTEAELQKRVLDLCDLLGLLVFHDNDSRRNRAGFPDLVIVGRHRVLYRELKTDTGQLRPEQKTWLNRLVAAGADAGVWRPRDWSRAAEILKALR